MLHDNTAVRMLLRSVRHSEGRPSAATAPLASKSDLRSWGRVWQDFLNWPGRDT